ncbi:MAG: type II toxin-antitoxin system HicA family toxin [Thermodesulfobacteriota bacterium]
MKRRELEEALRKLGWRLLRHGAKQDVWTDGERQKPVPRHTEINEKPARAILRRASRRD